MTTPPAAGSGQALPARVVELIDELARQCSEWGTATSEPAVAARAALVAAIADAIEAARVAERDKWHAREMGMRLRGEII